MDIKVVTICGSMKYAKEMITIASDLEKMELFGCCGKVPVAQNNVDEALVRRIVEEVLRSRHN